MLEKKALDLDASVPRISALVLMDSEGKRIAVDYFNDKLYVSDGRRCPGRPERRSRRHLDRVSSFVRSSIRPSLPTPSLAPACSLRGRISNVALQSELEVALYNKTMRTPTARTEAEIIMLDEHQAVYRFLGDLQFYVLGSLEENEILLLDVLTGFCESITILLRNQVEKKCVLENLDLVLLSMDELTEGGLILETDPAVIATRVTMRSGDEMGGMDGGYAGSPMGLDVNPGLQNLAVAFGNVREQLGRALLK